jgi:Bacterial extracellular solute-binding proteins, family 3
VAAVLVAGGGGAAAATLEDMRSSGILQCGADDVAAGFSARRVEGKLTGLAPDFCRAVAVAVFGDAAKVNITVLKPEERVEALQSGEIDLLVAALPVSAEVETRDGLIFAEPIYFTAAGEAYAPLLRQGDDAWFVALRWVRHVWVAAKPVTGSTAFGFAEDWQMRVVETGSFSLSYERAFGQKPIVPNLPVTEGGWFWWPVAARP